MVTESTEKKAVSIRYGYVFFDEQNQQWTHICILLTIPINTIHNSKQRLLPDYILVNNNIFKTS